jgi:hypothetical protein
MCFSSCTACKGECSSCSEWAAGNLQVLIDAVVHAVNEDYDEMAGDFIKLGFLSAGEWAGTVCLCNMSPEREVQAC